MDEIRVKAVCAYRTFSQSRSAVGEFLAGLWLAAAIAVITWFGGVIQGGFVLQSILTAVCFIWPFAVLTDRIRAERSRHPLKGNPKVINSPRDLRTWLYYGFVVSMTFGAAALLSLRLSWPTIQFGLGSAWLSTFALTFFGYFIYRRPIIGVSLVPAIVVMLAANIAPLFQFEWDWNIPIASLLVLVFLAVAWSGLGLLLLQLAEESHARNRLGPFTEFVSMTFLFVPLMLSVWVLGENLPNSETWQPVCVTVIGVLMSIIVSDPLKRFLKACWSPCPVPRADCIHRQSK